MLELQPDFAPAEEGYLLYLKSSITGDEGEIIREYRHGSPTFPHESTADQFFHEGQFEAYRALGQHIGEQALEALTHGRAEGRMSFDKMADCFESCWQRRKSHAGIDTADQA